MSKTTDAAAELEAAFFRSAPANNKKTASEDDWSVALKKFHAQAKEIRRHHALGILGRARLAYLLQQRLMAKGMPAEVVRKVVFALVMSSFTGKE